MESRVDVVVIGAGVNGLSAAAMLASRGRSVVVVESADVPGGAVRTAEVTVPGFRHDLFAMNLGLFAGGPVNAALGADLARHGFELVPSAKPFCSVFPDGTMLGVEADRQGADTVGGSATTSLGLGAIYQLNTPFRLLASGGPTFEDGGGAAGFHAFVALGMDF